MRLLPNFREMPAVTRSSGPSIDTVLSGKRVVLRNGDPADWKNWRMLREMSREFLTPWEPTWPDNGLSYSFFSGMLRRQWRDWRQDRAFSFFVFLHSQSSSGSSSLEAGQLIGGITLSDVVRGIAQKGTLGYWMGQPHIGQGYMSEAVGLVCDFAFAQLKLHRLEASCLPHNEPSKRLLARLGFDQEGYAKAYLQINGTWQDHILWGKTNPAG